MRKCIPTTRMHYSCTRAVPLQLQLASRSWQLVVVMMTMIANIMLISTPTPDVSITFPSEASQPTANWPARGPEGHNMNE